MTVNVPRKVHLRSEGRARCRMSWRYERHARFTESAEQATCKTCLAALKRADAATREPVAMSSTEIEPDEPPRSGPDYRVGNFCLLVSEACDVGRMAGADGASLGALSGLAHEVFRAVNLRGARVGEIVEAIRGLHERALRAGAVELTDSKVDAAAQFVVARAKDVHEKLGVSYEPLERIRLLAAALHDAIDRRGATVAEVVKAIRDVRPHGSILADLPSIQAKLRAENHE